MWQKENRTPNLKLVNSHIHQSVIMENRLVILMIRNGCQTENYIFFVGAPFSSNITHTNLDKVKYNIPLFQPWPLY